MAFGIAGLVGAQHAIAAHVGARDVQGAAEIRDVAGADLEKQNALVLREVVGFARLAQLASRRLRRVRRPDESPGS